MALYAPAFLNYVFVKKIMQEIKKSSNEMDYKHSQLSDNDAGTPENTDNELANIQTLHAGDQDDDEEI